METPDTKTESSVTKTNEITLTEEQQVAVDKINEWFDNVYLTGNNEFKLGGYAGTGKTTVIRFVRDSNKRHYTAIAAYTGKAVNVLQRKGLRAQTLHSLLYNVEERDKGKVEFVLKNHLDPDPDQIIIDEASMVSTELYEHLMSFKKPVIFVGDPGQLEPIGDNPNLMREPDFVLSKIHRQAELSPIITFANDVRLGKINLSIHKVGDELEVRRKAPFLTNEAAAADQVICAKNDTRRGMNDAIRKFKKYPQHEIVVGEKLICLRNNKWFGVFNGMILTITSIVEDDATTWTILAKDESGFERRLPLWKVPFMTDLSKDSFVPKEVVYCDYGYVVTCHKSQGSEWDNVIVYDEWMPPRFWDMKRWRYTAITRAAKKLTYLI